MSLSYIIMKGLEALTPNDGYDVGRELELLNQPTQQVYEMNSDEMSKLEHTIDGIQQTKPKKEKKRYKVAGAKGVQEQHRDEIEAFKGKGVREQYRDEIDEFKGIRPADNPTNSSNQMPGINPPEYLRDKLNLIGYNSWQNLVNDYRRGNANTLYEIGNNIMKKNEINANPELYEIILKIYTTVIDNKLDYNRDLLAKIGRDLDQIQMVSMAKKLRKLEIESIRAILKYEPNNQSMINRLDELIN